MTRDPAAAVLALLTAQGGYPDLCRTGVWWATVTYCGCGGVVGECDHRLIADHDMPWLPNPVNLASTAGATR